MKELFFTVVVLNLNKFLTIDFNKQKISSICAQQMLCLDYSNLQERINISKLYMLARGHLFPVYGLGNECAYYKRKMFQPKYNWVEIKYLGAIQNPRLQLFCLCDNALSRYTPAFASAIVAC